MIRPLPLLLVLAGTTAFADASTVIHEEQFTAEVDVERAFSCRRQEAGAFAREGINLNLDLEAVDFKGRDLNRALPVYGASAGAELRSRGLDCRVLERLRARADQNGRLRFPVTRRVSEGVQFTAEYAFQCEQWLEEELRFEIEDLLVASVSRRLKTQSIPAAAPPDQECDAIVPLEKSGSVLVHPQAAHTGLSCSPDRDGYRLLLYVVSSSVWDGAQGSDDPVKSKKTYPDRASCEAVRTRLIDRARDADPDNLGQRYPARREFKRSSSLFTQTLSVTIEGIGFEGTASFRIQ